MRTCGPNSTESENPLLLEAQPFGLTKRHSKTRRDGYHRQGRPIS